VDPDTLPIRDLSIGTTLSSQSQHRHWLVSTMASPHNPKDEVTLPRSAEQGDPPLDDVSAATSERDLDDTYQVYKNTEGLGAEEDEAKAVLRKIDFRVVPILFMTYFLQYLDKNSINFANAFGLQEGTNLTGQDYSWLG
jgi:hypothetical protein